MEPAPVIPSARQRALKKPAGLRPSPVALAEHEHAPAGRAEDTQEDGPGRPTGLALWWPTLVGIGLAFAAPRLWDQVQSAWGELGARIVFPYLLLCSRPELGFSQELAANLSQIMLYLQFLLEGLIVTWGLARGMRLFKAVGQVLFLQGLGFFVLWLIGQPLTAH